ncbi:MAG: hypothetical protein LBU61_06360 [Coriobacteriales bacterium]|jgi:hypothetical protein|nr:hypothetical protein [Coriobacteriales bacterium]
MLENDYLMRMILLFVRFLQQALGQRHKDPREVSLELENQIADSINIDAGLFFSLAPESMISLLQLGDFDERLAEYIVRAMALDAEFLSQAGLTRSAGLRLSQLDALAKAFSVDITPGDLTSEAIETFVESALQDLDDELN